MGERLVLTLDGSTQVCGAALLRPSRALNGGQPAVPPWEVVARRVVRDAQGQARILLGSVDEMLGDRSRDPRDLGAVVVGTGPGTFTGVRIAVATARALSLALSIPVLGVNTLSALTAKAARRDPLEPKTAGASGFGADPADVIIPVVDARRGQVFYGVYAAVDPPETHGSAKGPGSGVANARHYVRRSPFGVCDRGAVGGVVGASGRRVDAAVLVVAEGRGLVGDLPAGALFAAAEVDPEALLAGQDLLEEPDGSPGGRSMVDWLLKVLRSEGVVAWRSDGAASSHVGEPGTPESVRPIYVRSPDADLHILKMRDPFAADPPKTDVEGRG